MTVDNISICENTDIDYLGLTGNFMYRNSQADVKIMQHKEMTLIIDESQPKVGNYNRVRGFNEDNTSELLEILKIYKGLGVECPAFDFIKKELGASQKAMLEELRCQCVHSYQRLFLDLETLDKPANIRESIETRLVKTVGELELFHELFFSNEGQQDSFRLDEFYNFIAYEDKIPVGFASLFVKNDIGYILDDFTLGEHRGKGTHKSLINARIKVACDLKLKGIYTDVEIGSISHHNMKKCGLKDLVKKQIWLRT